MDLFRDIIGQKKITRSLSGAVLNGKLHHAYLFTGQSGVGKEAVAFELIKIVNCLTGQGTSAYCGQCRSCKELSGFNSDDLLYLFPSINKAADSDKVIKEKSDQVISELREKLRLKGYYKFKFKTGRFITLPQVDEIKNFARYNSINRSKKFVMITQCELMNKEAQNSLLKIIEEPPSDLFFILISENPSLVLDTIRSRCLNIPFPSLSATEIAQFISLHYPDIAEPEKNELARDSFGSIDTLNKLVSEQGKRLKELHERLYEIFIDTLPPKTVNMIDAFIEEIKELSDTETDYVLRKTLEKLLDNTYCNEKKDSLEGRKTIMTDFERFGIMYRRNVSPRLLMINLYLNYREEFKKWKTKQKEI
jgi:DNA polymerase III subunit delta'